MQRVFLSGGLAVTIIGCSITGTASDEGAGTLRVGRWGADMNGAIVTDTAIHVHFGCSFGDFPRPVSLSAAGAFTVSGEYALRAFPVLRETLPAQLSGLVHGNQLTLSVAVNDTVNKAPVALGPVTLIFGREPVIPPCPICRRPGERAAPRPRAGRWFDALRDALARRG